MIKKTITYKDLEGDSFTEDFFFNLTQSEITELEVSERGGLVQSIKRIQKTQDAKKVYDILKKIVLKSYGEKSDDKKRFIKSDELSKAFSETEAYDQLFMELISDPDATAKFIEGLLPPGVLDAAKKESTKK